MNSIEFSDKNLRFWPEQVIDFKPVNSGRKNIVVSTIYKSKGGILRLYIEKASFSEENI